MRRFQMHIGGRAVDAVSGQTFESLVRSGERARRARDKAAQEARWSPGEPAPLPTRIGTRRSVTDCRCDAQLASSTEGVASGCRVLVAA